MALLVTGGAGFVGSHLCEALLRASQEVVALDNFDPFYEPAIKHANLAVCLAAPGFCLCTGDIRDRAALDALFAAHPALDTVVHLAARAGVRPSIEEPLLYTDVNVLGTAGLLEAARRHGIRKFIFASSSSVYGNNAKVPFAEDDNVDFPISPYAATKKAGELLCHTYHHLYGMNITCLRFFTVYGPRQRPDLAIHKFARLIEAGRPIPVFGDGGMRRDHTYIDDIIAGTQRAIERCAGYHIYNLGESCPVSLSALIAALEQALGKRALLDRRPLQPGDVDQTYADISRARAALEYRPCTALAEGLARFVAWLRSPAAAITSPQTSVL
jgi:UDP-glucuronate 4-epimerase